MRETKEQKIIRLESQNLGLKKNNNKLKTEINKLKKQLLNKSNQTILNNELIEKEKILHSTINKLQDENEKLKLEHKNLGLTYNTISNRKDEIIRKKSNEISRLRNLLLSNGLYEIYDYEVHEKSTYEISQSSIDNEKYWRNRRLEEFNSKKYYATDKGSLYFYDENLIITIDPRTGGKLLDFDKRKILKTIENNPLYKQLFTEISQIEDLYTKERLTYEYGTKLYEQLYPDFNFDIRVYM